jgi:hypothetical protein
VDPHARLRGPLVDQEPPLLHHPRRPPPRRAAHAEAQRRDGAVPLDAWQRPLPDQAVVVVKAWGYAGTGHRTVGDAWLAASAAARARERRRIAREELTSTTAAALSLTA